MRSVWWTAGAAVLAAVLLVALSPRALPIVTIPDLPERPYAGEGKTLGSEAAPVLVEEFSDPQCPVCGRFAAEKLPFIEADYVATGQVRFVYKHFAFLGQESVQAAQAVECASEQGRAWHYLDTLFANQRGENRGAFADAYLKSFAEGLGLDTLDFNTCLDTGRYASVVEAESLEARQRGVQGTPTLFINGKLVSGGLPLEDIRQEIEAALAAAGG
jgi:protein-disulfide isomerase